MPTITINMNIPVEVKKEGDVYVAFCPVLDIASQGCSGQEARDNLAEAISLFFLTCIEMGTFSDVLKQCGFTPALEHPQADDGFEHINVPLPFVASSKLRGCHA